MESYSVNSGVSPLLSQHYVLRDSSMLLLNLLLLLYNVCHMTIIRFTHSQLLMASGFFADWGNYEFLLPCLLVSVHKYIPIGHLPINRIGRSQGICVFDFNRYCQTLYQRNCTKLNSP